MSSKKWEIRPTWRKAGLSSERNKRKPFWIGWPYVLIWPTWKIHQRRSEFSPWVKSCVKWENGNGIRVNSRTNKKANDEWHTCTQAPRMHGATGLNKGLEKASLKWIKSMGDPCKARVSQLVLCNFIRVCVCVCVKLLRFDIPALIATKLHTCTKYLPGKVLKSIAIS